MSSVSDHYVELFRSASEFLQETLHSENNEDARLVQKGLMLFRQGLVYQLKLEGDRALSTVQDVTPAKVALHLDELTRSSCSCPQDGLFCRHKLATFFLAYSQYESVSSWVENWRKPLKEKSLAEQLGLQRAKDLLKKSGQPAKGYEAWVHSFEESFQSILLGQKEPKPFVIPDLFQVYTRRLRAGAPVEQEWKTLYELVGAVFSIRKLTELSEELGHSEQSINRYYRSLFHELVDQAEEAIQKLSVHSLPFAFDEYITHLKDDTTHLLNDSILPYEQFDLYRLLWADLFKNSKWREVERTRLEKLEKIQPDPPVVLGLIHHYILARKDELALSHLHTLDVASTPYLLYWLQQFTYQKAWSRMTPYLEDFISKLRGYLTHLNEYHACMDFTDLAVKAISSYCVEQNRLDLYEKTLKSTLPYSYREYDHYLFDQHQYDKWAELQTYIGFDIDLLSDAKIKSLQKAKPETLLPLYHQSIQKQIELKNRTSYKEAVRQLKKLRTLYKKSNRLSDWERFFSALLEKTKRLRAFQEECKRGKLIHAENSVS
ncbi:SWIM zinc finger family protein [Cytobacillus spongiae]|uniref:SWIM zinc finger family protein n=1 Tax=Cytobacillus spongiae TaxID=2901381 RepID=UPI001F2E3607|nr:SWIM zinc finger family protein [Cytobacillus spongiae]UII55696.1 SWIM zinc finger family protein [Cytobacillus spongiae]